MNSHALGTSLGLGTPSRLGRYEVLKELGRGAMGVVYEARDPIIDRRVALKRFVVPDALYSEEFRQRFLREAHSAGVLHHTNVVAVYDVMEDPETNSLYIAMEHVDGINLEQWRREHPNPSTDQILALAAQIADGLEYAHSKGILHRDIKPANVLCTRDGTAKITDFGVARVEASELTADGQMLGTPSYMAPERILGEETDSRSDIFSLGVLLYELLTGAKPFRGGNLYDVANSIVNEPPPEAENVSAEVARILARALNKKPDDRYATASLMASDLRSALAAEGAAAVATEHAPTLRTKLDPRAAGSEPGSSSPVRRPYVIAALALAAVLVAAGALLRGGLSRGSEAAAAEVLASSAAPASASTPAESKPVPVADGTLVIDFYSEYPVGTLSVLADGEEIVHQDFRFTQKRKVINWTVPIVPKKTAGSLGFERLVAGGKRSIQVLVWTKGEVSRSTDATVEVPSGGESKLHIRLTRSGGLEASTR